jgi:hypothetical protein
MSNYFPVLNKKAQRFFSLPFFSDYRTILALWILMCVAMILKCPTENNFEIFAAVFKHTIKQLPLYEYYPEEYIDINLYGPVFSLVVAPFSVLPRPLNLFLWLVFLCLFLFVAIRRSDLTNYQQLFVFWFCTHELLNALFRSQFNIVIPALVLLTFTQIERNRNFYAAFFIMLGTLTKLYGIIGLAFFLFSKNKTQLIGGLISWALILFVAPMLISSPEYILGQYADWYDTILTKNSNNINGIAGDFGEPTTNISFLGMIRKISGLTNYSDIWLFILGIIAFAIPYLRINSYKYVSFRQMILASSLMFCVLFSSSSENSTYIIAFVGVAIWYCCVPWKRTRWDIALMGFAFILSSLSPGDLFPRYLREEYVRPYALKALPVMMIWTKLCWEMYTRDYSPIPKDQTPSFSPTT